jgi:hypothetical protein
MLGTVEHRWGHPDHPALDVRLEDGRLVLFWFHELDEVLDDKAEADSAGRVPRWQAVPTAWLPYPERCRPADGVPRRWLYGRGVRSGRSSVRSVEGGRRGLPCDWGSGFVTVARGAVGIKDKHERRYYASFVDVSGTSLSSLNAPMSLASASSAVAPVL